MGGDFGLSTIKAHNLTLACEGEKIVMKKDSKELFNSIERIEIDGKIYRDIAFSQAFLRVIITHHDALKLAQLHGGDTHSISYKTFINPHSGEEFITDVRIPGVGTYTIEGTAAMIEFGVVHGNAKDVADRSIIMSQLCEKVVNSLGGCFAREQFEFLKALSAEEILGIRVQPSLANGYYDYLMYKLEEHCPGQLGNFYGLPARPNTSVLSQSTGSHKHMDVRGERHTTLGLFLAGQYHMHCIREEYGDSWYEYYGADKLRVGGFGYLVAQRRRLAQQGLIRAELGVVREPDKPFINDLLEKEIDPQGLLCCVNEFLSQYSNNGATSLVGIESGSILRSHEWIAPKMPGPLTSEWRIDDDPGLDHQGYALQIENTIKRTMEAIDIFLSDQPLKHSRPFSVVHPGMQGIFVNTPLSHTLVH